MKKKLPRLIETDAEWNEWEKFLDSLDKEKLVDIILSRMSIDDKFMNMMHGRFSVVAEEEQPATDLITVFKNEIELECQNYYPDVDYIVSLSRQFMDKAEQIKGVTDRIAVYADMLIILDKSIVEGGAGMQDDDDWLIVEAMDEIRKEMMRAVKANISDDAKKEIQKIATKKIEEYNSFITEENYLELLLEYVKD